MKPTMYMLVGLPASGKSTWVKTNQPDVFVVSSDKHIEAHAKSVGKTYGEVFEECIGEATKQALKDFNLKVMKEESFVLDRTNLTSKGRMSFLKKLKKFRKVAVVFEVPEDVRKERDKTREEMTGKQVPAWVINNMRSTYVAPTMDEGFDEIIIVKD